MCIKRDKEKESKDSFFDGRNCAKEKGGADAPATFLLKLKCFYQIQYTILIFFA